MQETVKSNTRSTSRWSETGRTLNEHKRRVMMRRIERMQPLPRLAEIFRAMRGEHEAQRRVTIAEVSKYQPAESFAEFLRVNRLPVYDEVVR